jgi:hypothetical protein
MLGRHIKKTSHESVLICVSHFDTTNINAIKLLKIFSNAMFPFSESLISDNVLGGCSGDEYIFLVWDMMPYSLIEF